MQARAIFARVLVSRLETAASLLNKTAAIWAGDRPHSVRSARVTWASSPSAGWQQVKISLS